ncbi:hypothetical protein Q1695_015305 [Nippostrongylus brasiliensis]|nr:hypothetical protein Q1695_015305 [Nippostrongylus brasiliensis]
MADICVSTPVLLQHLSSDFPITQSIPTPAGSPKQPKAARQSRARTADCLAFGDDAYQHSIAGIRMTQVFCQMSVTTTTIRNDCGSLQCAIFHPRRKAVTSFS